MNELSPQSYKGTRDFYPSDQRVQNYIFSVWRKVSERYGYEEYSAPLLESLELYAAKSGQELVSEQTYSFVDRGGRTVTIRPEMTPSVSRMVAAKRQEIALPARLYSIANFMRYERPQKGRDREFWQLNVDIFGSDGIQPEAEMIAMAEGIMQEFGARSEDFIIKVNNRKLINFMMAQYFELDGAKATALIKLFDRKNKLTESEFKDQSKEIFDEQFNEKIEKLENIIKARSMADLPQEIRESSAVGEIQALFTLWNVWGSKTLPLI
jgi:histidyl-tRNA synthetase